MSVAATLAEWLKDCVVGSTIEQNYPEEFERLTKYVSRKSMQLLERLGSGVDGLVYSTNKGSAVKAHRTKALFEKELQVYEQLKRHPDNDFAGFNVPNQEEYHFDCWVIEMELGFARVPPPIVI